MAAQLGVEIGQRLVEQQHLRLQHERARHRDALLLAAGQFAGQAVAVAGQPDQLELAPARSAACALRDARGAQAVADILQHRHVREQRVGLEHHRRRRARRADSCVTSAPPIRMLPARSPVPARRSSAASSSCRSPTARAASPACRLDREADVSSTAVRRAVALGDVAELDGRRGHIGASASAGAAIGGASARRPMRRSPTSELDQPDQPTSIMHDQHSIAE